MRTLLLSTAYAVHRQANVVAKNKKRHLHAAAVDDALGAFATQ